MADPLVDFLSGNGWPDARVAPLAGDASTRRYSRVTNPGTGARCLLVDHGADTGTMERFLRLAGTLRNWGLSTPEILSIDHAGKRLLIEDFGESDFASDLRGDPTQEVSYYRLAARVIGVFQRNTPPTGLVELTADVLVDMIAPFFDHYVPAATGQKAPDSGQGAFLAELGSVLSKISSLPPVFCHRDFHSENLIYLPNRTGVARAGLIDFQDAVLAHPAYDLVSLVSDARRDVSPAAQGAAMDVFLDETGHCAAEVQSAFAALTVQRNLRILGIFARLCLEDDKPKYAEFVPRVWGAIERGLRHPNLSRLGTMLHAMVPPPDTALLSRLSRGVL